ncbi:MAG: hypothetical protein ACM3X9_13575 [Bacillota bacterium]
MGRLVVGAGFFDCLWRSIIQSMDRRRGLSPTPTPPDIRVHIRRLA